MKLIIDKWDGGIGLSNRSKAVGLYDQGDKIDPFRDRGYLIPGVSASIITKSDDATQIIDSLITDIYADFTTDDVYMIDDNKMYHVSATVGDLFNGNFDGASHYHYEILSGSGKTVVGESLAIYPIGTTRYLWYGYNNTTDGEGDIGRHTLGSTTFDDDYMSVSAADAGHLVNKEHPMMEWYNGKLYIGNGKYLAAFDGQTGDNGTFDNDALNLAEGWEITALFPTKNYIGICAWREHSGGAAYRTESAVFLWDGVSDSFNFQIPVADNKIQAALNQDGIVYLWTEGRDNATILRQLNDEGADRIRTIKYSANGSAVAAPYRNTVDIFANKIIWGQNSAYDNIWSYGKSEIGSDYALTFPWGFTGTVNSKIGALKVVLANTIYFSVYDGTKYYLNKIAPNGTTYTTGSVWKGNYFEPTGKVRVNYIKFYFKPLVAGDAVTPTLDIDYGTSVALTGKNGNATIAYATDGAITSKRFDVRRDCHCFRPTLTWGGGGVAFSKIVIDFDYISDI